MLSDDEPMAVPLWIDGHAFLTMAPAFRDVCNPFNGAVLRRTPMCDADTVRQAVSVAQSALASWAALPGEARTALLAALGEALASYGAHFAGLVGEESGLDSITATAEIEASVALLQNTAGAGAPAVLGVVGNSTSPLLGVLRLAAPALSAGAVVVVRPNPQTPSALFALAELTGRCGFPDGVFNIVHGGDAVVAGLRAVPGLSLLFS